MLARGRRLAANGAAAVAIALVALAPTAARGQSPQWTANLVVQPFPSPFIADWERNPQTAILTLLYSGTAAQEFHIEGFVRSADRGELARVVSPPLSFGFGPVSQVFTGADVLDWQTVSRDRQYTDLVMRTGVMPEGQLQMCARVVSAAGVQLAEACSDFTIALPEPPQLLFPPDGGAVLGALPVLQWTPVQLPPGVGVSYRVKVVRREPQQSPAIALASNPAWLDTEVSGAPMLVYPNDALPLEAGTEYVWQVEVLDGDGRPVTRGGQGSEIWTFTVGGPSRAGAPATGLPDTLVLVPGVARLTGLKGAEATATPFGFSLDGEVSLELEAPVSTTLRVNAEDLEVDATAAAAGLSLVRGGRLEGTVPEGALPPELGGRFLRYQRVAYSPDSGLTLGASLELPGAAPIRLSGGALVTAGGLFGQLVADGGEGAPLASFGTDPVRLLVRSARVTLPAGEVALDGGLELFARDLGCGDVSGVLTAAGVLTANVACTPATPLGLGGAGDRTQIAFRSVTGPLSLDFAAGTVTYDLAASGELRLDVGGAGRPGANCGGGLSLGVRDGAVEERSFTARCDAGEGESDLDWLHARLSSLTLRRLAYTAGSGFDFELAVDLQPFLPSLPGFSLPPITAVTITRDGLAVPAVDVAVTQPPLSLAGFGLKVTRVRLPAFTLSWNDWQARSPAGFHFALDAEVTLPQLPAGAPACLAGQPLSLSGAELADSKFRLTLAERRFTPPCGITLAAAGPSAPDAGQATAAAGGTPSGGSAGSEPGEWADPYGAMAEPETPWSAPPLVSTDDRWPADPSARQAQLDADRQASAAADQALRDGLDDPQCDDACVARLRDRNGRVQDSLQAVWAERDLGALRDSMSRCMTQATQSAQGAGGSGTTVGSCVRFLDSAANVVNTRIRARLDSSATCMSTFSYYARTALGIERQRQLLGAGEESSSVVADVLDASAPCGRAIQRRLEQTCASRPTQRLLQEDAAAVLGYERQLQLLGGGESSVAQDVIQRLGSCALNPQQPVTTAAGLAPPGQLAWSGVPPLAGESVVSGPSAAQSDAPDGSAEERRVSTHAPAAARSDTLPASSSGGVRLEIERIGGQLVVGLSPFFMVEQVPEIEGSLVLPPFFQCADSAARRQPLSTRLRLGPRGEVDGTVMGLVPSCPLDLAAVRITVTEATLTFSTAQGGQSAVLRAGATANFGLDGDSVAGQGNVAVDVLRGRLLSGSLAFQGPFRLDLPRQAPVLSFVLQSATLDPSGIHVDGRAQVALGDSQTIGVTFDHVTINPQAVAVSGGRILFDAPFAFEVGIAQGGALTWKAVPAGAPIGTPSGLRLDLPSAISLDSAGFTASGEGRARLAFDGRDVDSLSAVFSTDFGLALGPPGVARGSVDFRRGLVSLATVDAQGFHPNFAFFAGALLPARLGLPTESVAYLELRDENNNLRVSSENTGSGVRLYTPPGTTVPLVVPALQLGRAAAPRAAVSFDITLDPLGRSVTAGAIAVSLAPSERAAFDLSTLGLPVAIDTLAYDRGTGSGYRIALGGALTLFGGRQGGEGGPDTKVLLTLDGSGTLAGSVHLTLADSIPLVAGSDKLLLAVDSVVGSLGAAPATGSLTYDLAVSGALRLALGPGQTYEADATLEVTEQGVTATDVRYRGSDDPRTLDLQYLRLGLRNLRIPQFSWSAAGGFQFEILLDATLSFPTLANLRLPPIRDIALRNDGFTLPAYEIPDLRMGTADGAALDDTIRIGSLTLTPLAFRMGEVRYNWFTGQLPGNWGFGFDLDVGLGSLADSAPAALRNLRLRILNAGFSDGRLYGAMEPVRFAQPIDIGLGKLAAVWGRVPAPSGGPAGGAAQPDTAALLAAELNVDVVAPLPLCDASLRAGPDTVSLYADGSIAARIGDLTATCSGSAGPLTFSFAATGLELAGGPGGRRAELGLRGSVTLPGVGGGTVTATGDLRADLLQRRLISGRIAIDRPFRWTPPDNNPYLAFDVGAAYLDSAGVHFTGGGSLRLADGGSVQVTFSDLTLGLPDLKPHAGSVTFQSRFSLGIGIGSGGALSWGAYSLTAPRPAGSGILLTLPQTVTLDSAGLELAGSATASLAFQDSTYASLQVAFSDGFAVGFQPLKVAHGRADFLRGTDSIAHLDPGGFWPGNVFGLLPIPQRLGLPTADVAYVELKDGNGNLLIETSTDAAGLHLRTRTGAAVHLVVPALQYGAATPPSADVSFDVVVNPVSFQLVSGSIRAENAGPDGLFPLRAAGLPLVVRSVAYTQAGSTYALRLSARLDLPAALTDADLVLSDVTVGPQGLSGTASLGTYRATYDAALAPIKTVALGQDQNLNVEFTGVRATFGAAPQVQLSGALKSTLFAPQGGAAVPLFFTAQLSTTGLVLTVDPGQMPAAGLPVAVATFTPQSLAGRPAIQVTASSAAFTVRLSGVLRVPSLGSGFALTVDGLEVGTGGVKVPSISIGTGGTPQQFTLFGATLALQDSTAGGTVVYPAVAGGYSQGTLSLTMSGSLAFLGDTARFYGLTVTSAGAVSLAAANLLSQPLEIVKNVLSVDSLGIQDNRLKAVLAVTLPEPLNNAGPQRARFEVGADGAISGGASIAVLQEPAGLNPQSSAQWNLGVATFHLRYLGLDLDLAQLRQNSAVKAVADLYLQNNENNRIQVGDVVGGVVQPGLRVGFDGSLAWGNLKLSREFDYDFDAVKLKITNVSLQSQAAALAIGFSGQLSLALAAVSGALDFQDFTITSRGEVQTSPSGVRGGSFSIANVVRLSVSGFAYSATPTTLQIQSGSMPGAGQAASAGTQSIPVNSYVQFGGTLSLGDSASPFFSGGVEKFLLYRAQDQGLHLLIKQAQLQIGTIVKFAADFRYDENPAGFEMLMGAQGTLMSKYTATLVGAVSRGDGANRVGIFLAVDSLSIQVSAVNITGVGGGFFLNPKQEYLDLVRAKANVADAATAKISAPAGDFAVLLYGAIAIPRREAPVVEGNVLLTVSNTAIEIDGHVTLLKQQERIAGYSALVYDFRDAYVEGTTDLVVDYGAVVHGTGNLNFFVYGDTTWGIVGQAQAKIVGTLDATGRLFIGPPGFLIDATVAGGFNVWVVTINSTFDTKLWYASAAQQWGAYLEIGVEASVLGGVASAKGTLLGALILDPAPYVMAAANLTAQVLGASRSFMVWARFENGQASAGFGSDPAMLAAIDAARSAADQMTGARDQGQAAIDNVRTAVAPATVALTSQELVQAYNNIQGWSQAGWDWAYALIAATEYIHARQPGEGSYQAWYNNTLRRAGLPGDSALVASNTEAVSDDFQAIEAQRPAVQARVAAIAVTLAPAAAAVSAPALSDPVRGVSLADPVVTTQANPTTGLTEKVVISGPGFGVDAASVRAAQAALSGVRAQADAADRQVREGIVALESGLAATRAAVAGRDTASFSAFARRYADVATAAERQFAAQADLILQRADWTRDRLSLLYAREAAADTTGTGWITAKTQALRATGTAAAYAELKELAWRRVDALAGFSGNPGIRAQFTADSTAAAQNADQAARWEFFAAQADTAGRQLWYHMARAGMQASLAQSDQQIGLLWNSAGARLGAIRGAQESLSQSLASLYDAQAAASGALYDLYARYLYWRTGETWTPPSAGATATSGGTALQPLTLVGLGGAQAGAQSPAPPTAEMLTDAAVLRSRLTALAADLTVPRVNGVQVSVVSAGRYTAQLHFTWSAWHPSGVYEYEFRDVDGASQPLGSGFLSDGSSGDLTSYRFTTGTAASTVTRTFQASARGGAGFAGFARANYTVSFAATPTAPVAVSGGTVLADATPPTTPVVSFPNLKLGADAAPTAWTSDPNEAVVEWSAADDESGVAEYQYALWGTPSGHVEPAPGQILPLSALAASTEIRPFTSARGLTSITLSGLNLQPGTPVYVAVRARNPGGLVSGVGVSPALRYDPTPPTFAAGAALAPVIFAYLFPLTAVEPVAAACAPASGTTTLTVTTTWTGTLISTASATPVARVSFTRPDATDPESGIAGYWWKVGARPESTFSTTGWTEQYRSTTVEAAGPPLDYQSQFYVSVVALNGDGLASVPLTYGPFRVSDPTPPTDPAFCAALSGTGKGFALAFSKESADPETGVAGYQYRVRTAAGTVVRDWPASGVDWTLTSSRVTADLALTAGQSYVVDVRAVNGQGMATAPTGSGPVTVPLPPRTLILSGRTLIGAAP